MWVYLHVFSSKKVTTDNVRNFFQVTLDQNFKEHFSHIFLQSYLVTKTIFFNNIKLLTIMQLKRHVIEAILLLIFEYSYFLSKNLYKIVVTLLLKKQLMIVLDLAVWSPLYIW